MPAITPMRWRECWTALERANHTGRPLLGALVAAAFAVKRNTRRGCFTWCSPTSRRAVGQAGGSRTAGKKSAGRQQQIALGGEAMAQGGKTAGVLARAREADVAMVAWGDAQATPRRLSRCGLDAGP